MYIPKHFAEDDTDTITGLIAAFPFGVLVSDGAGAPLASHLPFLVERRGDEDFLIAHMARANPHWQMFDGDAEALVVFQGPHGYVSPNWYASVGRVPTWNYAAVHVYGVPRLVSPERTHEVIATLTRHFESGLPQPWSMDALAEGRRDALLAALVAFEIPMTRVEGKWKLGQNMSDADRAAAATGIETAGGDAALATLMRGVAKK